MRLTALLPTKQDVIDQFTTLKGITGIICAIVTAIGLYAIIRGHLEKGILLLIGCQVMLLRLEIAEIAGKL